MNTEEQHDQVLAPVLARFVPGYPRYVETGPGWWLLLLELDQKLAALHPDYTLYQVKEKFGGLRYYTGGVPAAVSQPFLEAVMDAEKLSYEICEQCGEPGCLRLVSGWYQTRCQACLDTLLEKRNLPPGDYVIGEDEE